MPKEARSAMEKLPFKPSPMEIELETVFEADKLGWKDAPSRYWPTASAVSFDLEPNQPASAKKVDRLEAVVQKLVSLQ